MVTVEAVESRTNNLGEDFMVFIISGGLEMVKAQNSGRYYATSRKASVACTFAPEQAVHFIGTKIPGRIVKVETEPYEYALDGGEMVTLTHRYEYAPDEQIADNVFRGELIVQ